MKSFGDVIYSEGRLPKEVEPKASSHLPRIEVAEEVERGKPFTLTVSVGPHPSTDEHSIRWIDVYVYEEGRSFNPIHAVRIELSPGVTEPRVSLTMKLDRDSVIHVLAYCNLHGVWESRKLVRVRG